MPTYQRFEDLPVWQIAIKLAEDCENFILITWSKRDQLDRASLSVSNNIAEGFERGTTNELLAMLPANHPHDWNGVYVFTKK